MNMGDSSIYKLGHAKITPLFIFIYLFDLAINLVYGPAIFAFSN